MDDLCSCCASAQPERQSEREAGRRDETDEDRLDQVLRDDLQGLGIDLVYGDREREEEDENTGDIGQDGGRAGILEMDSIIDQ